MAEERALVFDTGIDRSGLENGLAETYMLQNNYKYAGMLQESEEVAKNSKLGIWSDETSNIQNNERRKTRSQSNYRSGVRNNKDENRLYKRQNVKEKNK